MTAVYRSMADYCQSISGYATARALEKAADEIESLRAERDQLRARVAELHDSLTERDFVIEGLNAKHDARVQAIHDLYADQLFEARRQHDAELKLRDQNTWYVESQLIELRKQHDARVKELEDRVAELTKALNWSCHNIPAMEALLEGRAAVVPILWANVGINHIVYGECLGLPLDEVRLDKPVEGE